MKFSPNYDWTTSTKTYWPFLSSGQSFEPKVALWLWICPSLCILAGISASKLGVLSIFGLIWIAFAGATRYDQLMQLQHLSSEPISEALKDELTSSGLPRSLAERVRLRTVSELDANSWLGSYTFSLDYWNCLTPPERVAVIQRLANPYFLAFGWQMLVLVCAFVPLLSLLERATAIAFFSSYAEHEAKLYSEMIWKIPSIIAPMILFNFVCNRLLFWGDRKFAEGSPEFEHLISALRKSTKSSTSSRRIQRLHELWLDSAG